MTTLQAALDALAHDATTWDDVSATLSTAGTSAAGEVLTDDQFSWAGSATGLSETYAALKDKIAGLCQNGSQETTAAAAELRNVKTTYEGTDDAAKNRLNGVWDVA